MKRTFYSLGGLGILAATVLTLTVFMDGGRDPEAPPLAGPPEVKPLPEGTSGTPPQGRTEEFAAFPSGVVRTIDLNLPALVHRRLCRREQEDQCRDWLFHAILSTSGLPAEEVARLLTGTPVSRLGEAAVVAEPDSGPLRSCRLADGRLLALVPAAPTDAHRASLAEAADRYCVEAGSRPASVVVFTYEWGKDLHTARVTRLPDLDGKILFTETYGHREASCRNAQELEKFLSEVGTLTAVQVRDGALILSGRRSAATLELADVAALWQFWAAKQKEEAGLIAQASRETNELNTAWKQQVQEYEARWKDRFDPNPTKARQNRADALKDVAAMKADADGKSALIRKRLESAVAALWTGSGPRLSFTTPERDPTLRTARMTVGLEGTEAGMTVLYTDLLARQWLQAALTRHPWWRDEQLRPPKEWGTPEAPKAEATELTLFVERSPAPSSYRLPKSQGQPLYLGPHVLRLDVRVAGDKPVPPAAIEFSRWLNTHATEARVLEPQWARLDELARWVVVLGWLAQRGEYAAVNFLNDIEVKGGLWFPKWVAGQPRLSLRRVDEAVLPRQGDERETLPAQRFAVPGEPQGQPSVVTLEGSTRLMLESPGTSR